MSAADTMLSLLITLSCVIAQRLVMVNVGDGECTKQLSIRAYRRFNETSIYFHLEKQVLCANRYAGGAA